MDYKNFYLLTNFLIITVVTIIMFVMNLSVFFINNNSLELLNNF